MKRIIVCSLATFLFYSYGLAQNKKDAIPVIQLPVDSISKKITFEGVVEVKAQDAGHLYQQALKWFNSYYKNPTEVIRENDSVNHRIIGKPRFKIYNAPDNEGTRTDGGIVQYTITVASRDGRFKFELTDFNWKQTSYYPCEKWYDKTLPSYSKNFDEYIFQIDSNVRTIISDLKNAMMNEMLKKKDEW